jgi:DNA primase
LAEISDLAAFRRALRETFVAEIIEGDRSPQADREIDNLLASLNASLDEAPLAEEEKLSALYTRLIQSLAEIEDENERNHYVNRMRNLLRWDAVEAAVQAFRAIK